MKQIGIKYGVITGLFYIIAITLSYMYELAAQGGMTGIGSWVVTFGVTFVFAYIAVKELREEQGFMTAGQGLKMGVTIGLIAGAIAAAYTLLYTQILDPDVTARILEATMETLEEKGLSDDEIEAAMSMSENLSKPAFTIPISIIVYTIGGLIKGVISGAILKQEKPI